MILLRSRSPQWTAVGLLFGAAAVCGLVSCQRSPEPAGLPPSVAIPEPVAAVVEEPTGTEFAPTVVEQTAEKALAPAAPEYSLPEAETAYLWDLEHHNNALMKFGFSALSQRIQEDDAAGLAALLTSDFEGTVAAQPREVVFSEEHLSVTRQQSTGDPSRLLNRDEFVAFLREQRHRFSRPPQVHWGVMSLSPRNRAQPDDLWQCDCRMRLWGETSSAAPAAKPAEVVLILRLLMVRPARERLAESAWLAGCDIQQITAGHSSAFLFRDVTQQRGIITSRYQDNWKDRKDAQNTGGVYACDYNRDGCTDLLVTDLRPPGVVLYEGRPDAKLREVTSQLGLLSAKAHMTAAMIDLDNDGWEDFISAGGQILKNEKGQRFTDVTTLSNLFVLVGRAGAAPSRITAFIPGDYDRDGLVDLYVTRLGEAPASWLGRAHAGPAGNILLRNRGNWRFEDVTRASATGGGGRTTFSSVWFDANNDGWPDLYVIDEFGNGVLLVNQTNGSFAEHSLTNGPADFGSMGITCGDIDNDGWIDLYSANMYSKAGSRVIGNLASSAYPPEVMARLRSLVAGSQLYRNRGGLKFEPAGRAAQVHDVGWSFGPLLADLNNDGWLDIHAPAGFMSRDRGKPDG